MNQMLEECQNRQLKEIATSQGDITVDKFEEKRNVIHCPSPPSFVRSKNISGLVMLVIDMGGYDNN